MEKLFVILLAVSLAVLPASVTAQNGEVLDLEKVLKTGDSGDDILDLDNVFEIEDIDGSRLDLMKISSESPILLVFYRGFD